MVIGDDTLKFLIVWDLGSMHIDWHGTGVNSQLVVLNYTGR